MKVHYFVHGRGLGHASRALPIIDALLEDGHELRLFGSCDSRKLLGDIESFEVIPPDFISQSVRRLKQDLDRIRDDRPDVVVSDGDAPSLIAAYIRGIPTISIGHVLIFSRCHLPFDLPRWALAAQWFNGFKLSQTAHFVIACHFLPISASQPLTRVARPVLRSEFVKRKSIDNKVVCYFRDANGSKAVEYAVEAGADVICFSDPPLAVSGADCRPRNSIEFADELSACSAVITSSGSNICAEAVMMKKPILALHKKWDSEQLMNGLLLEKFGVGRCANFENLTKETVSCFLKEVGKRKFATIDLETLLPDTVSAMRGMLAELR